MKAKNFQQLLLVLLLTACGTASVGLTTAPEPTFTPVVSLPDLMISSVSLRMQGDMGGPGNCVSGYGPLEIRVVIRNMGLASAQNISVVELSTGTELNVDELGPFEIFELNFAPTSATGTYNIAVDAQNAIAEIDENNNTYSYIAPTPTPPRICTPTPPAVDATPVASFTPFVENAPLPDTVPLIVWQSAGTNCQIVSFWADRLAYEPCPAASGAVRVGYPILSNYFSRYEIWAKAYAPFAAQTKLGTVTFTGSGYVIATPAEQRMMAEWSALMLAGLPEGNSSSGGSYVISKQFNSDTSCFSMVIHPDGHYIVESCLPGSTYPARDGYLGANELIHLYRWLDGVSTFRQESASGLLTFIGNGTNAATTADMISMDAMVHNIEFRARAAASGGGLPPGALAAQKLLSNQLGIPLNQIQLRTIENMDFPDTCLGAPQPNENCAQIITPGLRVQLVAQGLLYEFHTDVWGYELRLFGKPVQAPQGAG